LVRETITDRFAGTMIQYINNREYAMCNSMYNLALSLEALDSPTWVLERDVFFGPSILKLTAPPDIA
jgi:CTP:phosphocholine cytidylyltransferase-like protein